MALGLSLIGGAKESHRKELYCVVWSHEIHVGYGDNNNNDGDGNGDGEPAADETNDNAIIVIDCSDSDTTTDKDEHPAINKHETSTSALAHDNTSDKSTQNTINSTVSSSATGTKLSNTIKNVIDVKKGENDDAKDTSCKLEQLAPASASAPIDTSDKSTQNMTNSTGVSSLDTKPSNTRENANDAKKGKHANATNTRHSEKGKEPFYCRYLATCGGHYLTLYQVKVSEPGLKKTNKPADNSSVHCSAEIGSFHLRQAYRDVDKDELFYACLFAGRSTVDCDEMDDHHIEPRSINHPEGTSNNNDGHDHEGNRWPPLVCVGGKRGLIKVIDTLKQSLVISLIGHTDEIYDLKRCPTDEWLILSASNDETIRLWNLKVPTCICIFAGHNGHREAVLSVDWHPMGDYFVSSGMDGTIKLWSCEDEKIKEAVKASFLPCLSPFGGDTRNEGRKKKRLKTSRDRTYFPTVFHQLPFYSTSKVHTDYIDCVSFVGDLILSKSTTNSISLWKPIFSDNANVHKFIHLQDYAVPDCSQWFIRFATDRKCKMLAVGNGKGDVRIWEIGRVKKPIIFLNTMCTSIVRMVSFSPSGKAMAAVCDDGSVWNYKVNMVSFDFFLIIVKCMYHSTQDY